MKKLTLAQWDKQVRPHLQGIEMACDLLGYHSDKLTFRPDFEALCEDAMLDAEASLEGALARLKKAREVYGEKPRVG